IATGQPIDKGPRDAVPVGGNIVISGDGKRFVAGGTGIATVRDTMRGEAIQQIKPLQGFSTTTIYNQPSIALSHDGKVLAQGGTSTGGKGSVCVWDVEKNEILFQAGFAYNGPPIPVVSADGKFVATRPYQVNFGQPGKNDRPGITVWEVDGGKEL